MIDYRIRLQMLKLVFKSHVFGIILATLACIGIWAGGAEKPWLSIGVLASACAVSLFFISRAFLSIKNMKNHKE